MSPNAHIGLKYQPYWYIVRLWILRCITFKCCMTCFNLKANEVVTKILIIFLLDSVKLDHAVFDSGNPKLFSVEAQEAMHPCNITEWPAHYRDLEGFNHHCCRRSRSPREHAGVRSCHFLGPTSWHCQTILATG